MAAEATASREVTISLRAVVDKASTQAFRDFAKHTEGASRAQVASAEAAAKKVGGIQDRLAREQERQAKQRAREDEREARDAQRRADWVYRFRMKQHRDEQKAAEDARKREDTNRKRAEQDMLRHQGLQRQGLAKAAEAGKQVMEGTMQLARAMVLLGLANERDVQVWTQRLAVMQATFDLGRGGINVLQGLAKAYSGVQAAAAAAAAAQAAAGMAAGGGAVAGAAGGSAARGIGRDLLVGGGAVAATRAGGLGLAAKAMGVAKAAAIPALALAGGYAGYRVASEVMSGNTGTAGWLGGDKYTNRSWTDLIGSGYAHAGAYTGLGFRDLRRSNAATEGAERFRGAFSERVGLQDRGRQLGAIRYGAEREYESSRWRNPDYGATSWERGQEARRRLSEANRTLSQTRQGFRSAQDATRTAGLRGEMPDYAAAEGAGRRYLDAMQRAREEKERELEVQRDINRERVEGARRVLDSVKQESAEYRARYDQVRQQNRSARERFGGMELGEQRELVTLAGRLRGGEKLTPEQLGKLEPWRELSVPMNKAVGEQLKARADAGGYGQFVGQEAAEREAAWKGLADRKIVEAKMSHDVVVRLERDDRRLAESVAEAVKREMKDYNQTLKATIEEAARRAAEEVVNEVNQDRGRAAK